MDVLGTSLAIPRQVAMLFAGCAPPRGCALELAQIGDVFWCEHVAIMCSRINNAQHVLD